MSITSGTVIETRDTNPVGKRHASRPLEDK